MNFIEENPTLSKVIAHLSVFINLIPFAGLIITYLIYSSTRESNLETAQEAIKAFNWQVTMILLAFVITFITFLTFGILGVILWPIYTVTTVLFPVLGAIKTTNHQPYFYPFSILIIK